jgi:hypothetical protein
MVLESNPSTGANQWFRTPEVRTVTDEEVNATIVAVAPSEVMFWVAMVCAVCAGVPHSPSEQSWAMASAAASAPVCNCSRWFHSAAASIETAAKPIMGTMSIATTTPTAPRSSFIRCIA